MNKRHILKQLLSVMLVTIMFCTLAITSYATEVDDLQNEINSLKKDITSINQSKKDAENAKNEAQSGLNSAKSQINSISGAMGDLGAEIDETTEILVGVLTDIDLITADIANKKQQIAETQVKYEGAVEDENNQYAAMKIRCKYMYEVGEMSYLSIFLESANFADALNKADYIEQLYTYDREMLERYQAAVAYTKQVWDELEEEKSELETSKIELEEEEKYLEQVKAEMEAEYENYDVLLSQAKKQAASYSAKINQQTFEIKKLEQEAKAKQAEVENKQKEVEEAKKKAEQEAAQAAAQAALEAGDLETAQAIAQSNTSIPETQTTTNSAPAVSVSGSGTGSAIASYGLQFVGNPYVAGGTSLTNGADCSGFVQSVYKHFGYSLPRSSYAQATVGKAVSYSEAQPGDVIYYGGHVGIYIGNGQIVHASTERTGIKVTNATYRSIITIRRIV